MVSEGSAHARLYHSEHHALPKRQMGFLNQIPRFLMHKNGKSPKLSPADILKGPSDLHELLKVE